jgi:hypothetical protein
MLRFVQEGGIYSWAVLAVALPAIGFALAHAFVGRRWTLVSAVGLLLLVVGIGFGGRQHGRQRTEHAVEAVAEQQIDNLMRAGYAQAARPLQLGLGVAALMLIPLVVGSARMLRQRRED